MTRRLKCHVDAIVAHGDRVYTVTIKPESPAPAFRAGQFLHLALDTYDPSGFWPESRVFSIASSPLRRGTLDICYSVKGAFTTRMESELREGREVWVKMPYGEFVLDASSDVVLLAGGTGISAFTAALESAPDNAHQSVVLGYGARTPELLIYRPLVERWRQSSASFDARYFVEHPSVGDDTAGTEAICGPVSVGPLWGAIPRPADASYYISGPPAMLRGLTLQLRERGIADEAIHIDAWE